jgi:hypothetical protein
LGLSLLEGFVRGIALFSPKSKKARLFEKTVHENWLTQCIFELKLCQGIYFYPNVFIEDKARHWKNFRYIA